MSKNDNAHQNYKNSTNHQVPPALRVYEEWDAPVGRWRLKKIEFLFPDDDLPGHTDSPEASVGHQHGWIVPPVWEFISEVREFERKPESKIRYARESEIGIIGNYPYLFNLFY